MTSAAKKILEDALSLPEEDRRRLSEALLDSIPRESSEEVRRIEQVQQGEAKPEAWSEVKKHIRDALDR